jgi:hypothetical protein
VPNEVIQWHIVAPQAIGGLRRSQLLCLVLYVFLGVQVA